MRFDQVIKRFGYPAIGKEVANAVYGAKRGAPWAIRKLNGLNKDGEPDPFRKQYKKYKHLVDSPFLIGDGCCRVMKKNPAALYSKETGRKPFIGTLACESALRKTEWLKNGCNAFHAKKQVSTPMAFWTEQDVLQYIVENNLEYASVYGEIKKDENGKYYTTGADRTGCMFCMFGCHLEKSPNRFQRMKETHPRQYEYCIGGGEMVDGVWQPNKQGLGLGKVLDDLGVKYE